MNRSPHDPSVLLRGPQRPTAGRPRSGLVSACRPPEPAAALQRRFGLATLVAAGLLLPACGGSDTPAGPAMGSVEVTTATTGDDVDADGYDVFLDDSAAGSIDASGSVTLSDVVAGTHRVRLGGVQVNCAVTADNPLSVSVADGAIATAAFGVGCRAALIGRIAFVSGRDGATEVYAMDVDGSSPVNLTNHSYSDDYAAVSSDGTRVAFTTNRDGNAEIYVMNADGSDPVNLTQNAALDIRPVWSPDGTKILFNTRRDGDGELYVMDADGSNPTNLSNHPGALDEAGSTWSPDGSRVAYARYTMTDYEIFVADADGSNLVNLTQDPGLDTSPAWSPDGSKIAFVSDRDGDAEIWVMNADGSDPVQLTANSVIDNHPSWSRDGVRIAFMSRRSGADEVWVMDADGSNAVNLSNDPGAVDGVESPQAWGPQ